MSTTKRQSKGNKLSSGDEGERGGVIDLDFVLALVDRLVRVGAVSFDSDFDLARVERFARVDTVLCFSRVSRLVLRRRWSLRLSSVCTGLAMITGCTCVGDTGGGGSHCVV